MNHQMPLQQEETPPLPGQVSLSSCLHLAAIHSRQQNCQQPPWPTGKGLLPVLEEEEVIHLELRLTLLVQNGSPVQCL